MNRRKRILMKIVLLPLIAILIFYALLLLTACALQERMVFFPTRTVDLNPQNLGMAFEDLRLDLGDDQFIAAWFVPRAEDSAYRATILLCHGNGGNISHRLELLELFSRAGFDTLIFDYRGYGLSTGKASEKNTYADAERAWKYLTEERGVPAEQIVLVGRSLGGAVAAHLAKDHTPAALVLDSTFSSLADIGAHFYPYLPVRLLGRIKYETLRSAQEAHCPILVMHDPDDTIVPCALGRKLYDALPEPKCFAELRGGHNESYMVMGKDYTHAITRFLDAHVLTPPGPAPLAEEQPLNRP